MARKKSSTTGKSPAPTKQKQVQKEQKENDQERADTIQSTADNTNDEHAETQQIEQSPKEEGTAEKTVEEASIAPKAEQDTDIKDDDTDSSKKQIGDVNGVLADRMQEIDLSDSNVGDSKAKDSSAPPAAAAETATQSVGQTSPRSPLSPSAIGIVRTSSKSPATSHPLQDNENAAGSSSPASIPKKVSFESSTAGNVPGTSQGSRGRAANRVEVAEVSSSEDDDPVEAHEEGHRRRFRLAEQRRLQKEQLAQKCVSSEEMETMRSGLYNARECVEETELRVLNGAFPEGLRGSLVMVGPGQLDISYSVQGELEQSTRTYTFGSLLDALPLLTRISFDASTQRITHRSRLIAKHVAGRIQTEHGVSARKPGALYMSDSNQTVLARFMPRPAIRATAEGDCCSQDVQLSMPLLGSTRDIVCTNHAGALQTINGADLRPREIVETRQINKAFACSLSCPHMQYDADTREHLTVLQDVGFRSATYSVVAISDAQPDGYVVATFTAQASVLHSFAVTRDYVIVPVYPYAAPVGGPAYRWDDSLLTTLEFDRSQPAVFYVISREYRRVHCAFRAPAFFALHQINAVQDAAADTVAIDCIAYEDDTVLRRLRIDALRKASASFAIPSAQLRRYQLPHITMEAQRYVAGASVARFPPAQPMALRSEPAELACISPAVAGKPYTFAYGISHVDRLRCTDAGSAAYAQAAGSTVYNCLVKLNVADADAAPLVWSRKHCHPAQPVFVPRSSSEDDGYLVTVFFDSMRIASCLLVLDAATFNEVLIAQLPSPVP
ncbi:hypothetical protein EV175_003256, partial [Coemansia sp. RSA 1933]